MKVALFLAILNLGLLAFSNASARNLKKSNRKIHRKLDPIDSLNKYHVEWQADLDANTITFRVVVETTGYIGFGLSTTGGMLGADIVIGGVYPDGVSYFSDRHGVGRQEPVLDFSQDWELTAVYANATHTDLTFSRLLNTCDDQDVVISSDTLKIIWAYGETDVLVYHGSNRGTYAVNLLDPEMPPFDSEGLDNWSIVGNLTMPPKKTTYWCSLHRSPASYNSKRHVVAFNTKLTSPESIKHTHHLSLSKCTAPEGVDPAELFEPYIGKPGGECYVPPEESLIPLEYCRQLIYVWAVGGRTQIFPENVGFPITENDETEYLLYEIHYDNPDELQNVQFESTVEIFNTPELRQDDAAVLLVAKEIIYSHLIPPNTPDYTTVGHCGSACTSQFVRPEGINLFNIMLHGHLTASQIRLRHFRNNVEEPWVIVDDKYDFDFQQNRPLAEHRKVLPGDHLTVECVSDTANKNGVTLGGLSTTEEMCEAIIWYYPRDELQFCSSAYSPGKLIERFGVEEISWDNILLPPTIIKPASLANKTFVQYLDTMVDWNAEMISELQQETRYNNHFQTSCWNGEMAKQYMKPAVHASKVEEYDPVGYPEIEQEYQPENPCVKNKM